MAFLATALLVACTLRTAPDGGIAAVEAATGVKVNVIRRLDSSERSVDFDKDGRPDVLAVITAPAGKADYLASDAFSYGPDDASGARCLLVALADLTRWQEKGSIRILCGRSPVLVLSPEQPVPQLERLLAVAPWSALAQRVPIRAAAAAKGDAVILQTEAGDSAVVLTKDGFHWEELPGGD